MKLDYSVLQNAIDRLGESLDFTQKAKAENDLKIYALGRTAAIQSFEFCYELASKMLRRHLEITEHSEAKVDTLTFANLLRLAAEREIIAGPLCWLEYRKDRNKTSHGYNEVVAEEIYCDMDKFFIDVSEMLNNMKARDDVFESDYLDIVRDILKRIVPECDVRAFGSRVHGEQLKKFSDLDLVIMTKERLPFKIMNELEDEFSEAMIPFRVDVLDWTSVSPEFRKIIDANYEVMQSGKT